MSLAERVYSLAATLLCLVLGAASVFAEEPAHDERAARLFDEARMSMEDQDYAAACPKLQESQQLDPQLGTLLHLAYCYEKQGRAGTAYLTFQAVAALAAERTRQGVPEPRERLARERAANLESQLSLLELRFSNAPPELEVALDDAPMPRAQWRSPRPIEPGEHVLRASAPGLKSWEHTFVIARPGHATIDVPALRPGLTLVAPQLSAAATAPAPSVPVQRIAGYAVAGVGITGIGLGIAFGLLRNGKVDKLGESCDLAAGRCTIAPGDAAARERLQTLRSDASGYATAANLSWILGGLALAGGVALVLTAPRADTPALTLHFTPGGLLATAHTRGL